MNRQLPSLCVLTFFASVHCPGVRLGSGLHIHLCNRRREREQLLQGLFSDMCVCAVLLFCIPVCIYVQINPTTGVMSTLVQLNYRVQANYPLSQFLSTLLYFMHNQVRRLSCCLCTYSHPSHGLPSRESRGEPNNCCQHEHHCNRTVRQSG